MGRGRKRAAICLRGHDRQGVLGGCVTCRREKERLRYKTDPEFRTKKIKQVAEYKKAFFEKNGFRPWKLYDPKPKTNQ